MGIHYGVQKKEWELWGRSEGNGAWLFFLGWSVGPFYEDSGLGSSPHYSKEQINVWKLQVGSESSVE